MNIMKYKGYLARIEYSADDGCLIGRVIGMRDIIGFHGDSVEAIEKEFHESIDFYIDVQGGWNKAATDQSRTIKGGPSP